MGGNANYPSWGLNPTITFLQGNEMKVACLSDIHGHLPEIPDADLLLLAGDYCPTSRNEQRFWFAQRFAPWLEGISKRMPIIGISGNHDWFLHDKNDEPLDWTYLQDSGTTFDGMNVYGTPWQPIFHDWAFNADGNVRAEKWALIPKNTDVLVLHGPPFGIGDTSCAGGANLGCPLLRLRIEELQPKLVVCGHIHGGFGRYCLGETQIVNAAYVDEKYRPTNGVTVVELQ